MIFALLINPLNSFTRENNRKNPMFYGLAMVCFNQ